jgi:hypothetical protein
MSIVYIIPRLRLITLNYRLSCTPPITIPPPPLIFNARLAFMLCDVTPDDYGMHLAVEYEMHLTIIECTKRFIECTKQVKLQ